MKDLKISGSAAYRRAAALGFVAGLRSMTPLAVLAAAAQPHGRASFAARGTVPLSLLRSRGALAVAGLAAVGEYIGDKLPSVPSRTEPGPLGGRIVIGALIGAAVSREAGRNPVPGALVGGTAAGVGAYAGVAYRKTMASNTAIPDTVWAILEDAVAVGVAYSALREYFS